MVDPQSTKNDPIPHQTSGFESKCDKSQFELRNTRVSGRKRPMTAK